MTHVFTEEELRPAVVKSNTPVLIAEVVLAQSVVDEATVKKLNREILIKCTIAVRKALNQNSPVKSQIKDFKFDEDLLERIKKCIEEATLLESAQSESVKLMMGWMQMMERDKEKQREDDRKEKVQEQIRREAKEAEDRKEKAQELIRREAKEKEMQDKQEAKEKEMQNKQELKEAEEKKEKAQEQARREAREIELQQRLELKGKEDRTLQMEKMETDRMALLESLKIVQAEIVKRSEDDIIRRKEESEKRDTKMARAVKATKGILYTIPTNPISLIVYFRNVDKIFEENNIEDELRISLLTVHLQEPARKIIAGLPDEDKSSYLRWKESLLREFHVTARKCRKSFMRVTKTAKESCVQFLARLRTLYTCYVEARGVEKSFEAIMEMVIADRFRDSLTKEERLFIANKELGNYVKGSEMARIIDVYQNEKADGEEEDMERYGHRYNRERDSRAQNNRNRWSGNGEKRRFDSYQPKQGQASNQSDYGGITSYKQNNDKGANGKGWDNQRKEARAIPKLMDKGDSQKVMKSQTLKTRMVEVEEESEEKSEEEQGEIELEVDSSEEEVQVRKVEIQRDIKKREEVQHGGEGKINRIMEEVVEFVDFGVGKIPILVDSGSDISVVRSDMIGREYNKERGAESTVILKSAFGKKVKAVLKNVRARLKEGEEEDEGGHGVVLLVAITDELSEGTALITPQDYQILKEGQVDSLISEAEYLADTHFLHVKGKTNQNMVQALECKLLSDNEGMIDKQEQQYKKEVGGIENFENNFLFHEEESAEQKRQDTQQKIRVVEVEKQSETEKIDNQQEQQIDYEEENKIDFKELQLNDSTLKICWDALGQEETKFLVEEGKGLLVRRKKIGGIEVKQLVVPKEKRALLLSQAHAALTASHLGIDKTAQRLFLYYYWPNLKRDVINYVGSCQACQRRSRIGRADKVKIKAVPRSQVAFEDIAIDLIGEIVPASSA